MLTFAQRLALAQVFVPYVDESEIDEKLKKYGVEENDLKTWSIAEKLVYLKEKEKYDKR